MQPTNSLRTAVILSALHISTMCTSKPVILGAGGKDGNNEQRKTQVLSRGTLVDNELPVEINLESAPRAATATAPIPVSIVPTASAYATPPSYEEKELYEEKIPEKTVPFFSQLPREVLTSNVFSCLTPREVVRLRLVSKEFRKEVDSYNNSVELLGEYEKADKDYIKGGAYEKAFKNPNGGEVKLVMDYKGEGLRKDFMGKFIAYVISKEGKNRAKAVGSLKKVVAQKRCLLGYIKNSLGVLSPKNKDTK